MRHSKEQKREKERKRKKERETERKTATEKERGRHCVKVDLSFISLGENIAYKHANNYQHFWLWHCWDSNSGASNDRAKF